jgi:hypothetical protein
MIRYVIFAALAALAAPVSAGELYVQAEAMRVEGEIQSGTKYRAGDYLVAEEACSTAYHCYTGHNLLTLEFGASLGPVDLFARHTSSADAQDRGINGVGLRFRHSIYEW